MAEVTITVQPGFEAALVGLAAAVAIDLAAIRWEYATISRWLRHQIHQHPVIAAGAAVALGLHLTCESPWDPAGWLADLAVRWHRTSAH